MTWRTLIGVSVILGCALGVWRASERAATRPGRIQEFYFVKSHDWLCFQQQWSTQEGIEDALNAWSNTLAARVDGSSARGVEATRRQLAAGRPLGGCKGEVNRARIPSEASAPRQ